MKRFLKNSKKWEDKVTKKQENLIKKLKKNGKSVLEILDIFYYNNLKTVDKNYCELFKRDLKCHCLEKKDLNCIGCYCKNYELISFIENDITYYGRCKINSFSKSYVKKDEKNYILDCSFCIFPHQKSYAYKTIMELYDKF